jgi:phage terminase large subunit-like protein
MLSPKEFVEVHLQKLEDYISSITGGTVLVNKFEKLAVERFIEHKTKYIYKESEVIKALRFFSLLNIQIKNEVKQTDIMPFQMLWLASIVGLYKDDSTVLYNQSYVLVAKKNNKTGFAALMAIYYAIGKQILNSHSLLVAASREQARVLLSYVEFIIKNSPVLTDLFNINKNIIYNRNDLSVNRIEVRASEASKIQGIGVGLLWNVVDEYSYHSDAQLQESIKSAQIIEPNAHQFIIGTAANNLTNPSFTLYESAKNILNKIINDDSLFIALYHLDNKEEYKEKKNYRKSNPALGYTITEEGIEREVLSAIALPQKLETVINHHFNLFLNADQESFISDDLIKELMNLEKVIPTGSTVSIGADFSSLNDLSALSVVYYDKPADEFIVKVIHIMPNNDKRKIKAGSIDLQRWIDEGYIVQCDSKSLDENLVIDLLRQINNKYKIQSFGFDPFNARILAIRIESELKINCIEVRQNYTMSYPTKFLEKYMSEMKFFFDKSPVTRWQFQNLRIKTDSKNNYHIGKAKGESVDGIVATVVGLTVFLQNNYSTMGMKLDSFNF